MQRDDRLEAKLQQLKEAYEKQPQMTDADQLVSKLYNENGMNNVRKKRKLLPAMMAAAVVAIIGVLIVATPELLESPENATEQNESAQILNKENVMRQENNTFENEDSFTVHRSDTKVDTIEIEGMPQEVTFNLVKSRQLQISTYYPEDMLVEHGENKLTFIANFGGVKNTAAYVEIYGERIEGDIDKKANEMVASLEGYAFSEKSRFEYFLSLSELEYFIEKGDFIGTVSLFERDSMLYRITIHYPAEYGDGIDPRASKIISELQFH